jgi:hypothetical protein
MASRRYGGQLPAGMSGTNCLAGRGWLDWIGSAPAAVKGNMLRDD